MAELINRRAAARILTATVPEVSEDAWYARLRRDLEIEVPIYGLKARRIRGVTNHSFYKEEEVRERAKMFRSMCDAGKLHHIHVRIAVSQH